MSKTLSPTIPLREILPVTVRDLKGIIAFPERKDADGYLSSIEASFDTSATPLIYQDMDKVALLMADFYFSNKHPRHNADKAFKYYGLSARMGNAQGQYTYAAMITNSAEAVSLLEKSAAQGLHMSAHWLHNMFMAGKGVEKDMLVAAKWLIIAKTIKARGLELKPSDATDIEGFELMLGGQKFAQAKEQAEAWLAQNCPQAFTPYHSVDFFDPNSGMAEFFLLIGRIIDVARAFPDEPSSAGYVQIISQPGAFSDLNDSATLQKMADFFADASHRFHNPQFALSFADMAKKVSAGA